VKDILCETEINQSDKTVIITVMYSIWSSRNSQTHDEAGCNPTKTMEFVRETLQTLELPRDKVLPGPARQACKWQGPPDDFIKINSDMSCSP
jgi:hypothetical protein